MGGVGGVVAWMSKFELQGFGGKVVFKAGFF